MAITWQERFENMERAWPELRKTVGRTWLELSKNVERTRDTCSKNESVGPHLLVLVEDFQLRANARFSLGELYRAQECTRPPEYLQGQVGDGLDRGLGCRFQQNLRKRKETRECQISTETKKQQGNAAPPDSNKTKKRRETREGQISTETRKKQGNAAPPDSNRNQ